MKKNEVVWAYEKTCAYARKYAMNNLKELERKYEIKYLAIAENAGVIDSDENKLSLVKRLQANGDQRGIVIDTIVNLTKPRLYNN